MENIQNKNESMAVTELLKLIDSEEYNAYFGMLDRNEQTLYFMLMRLYCTTDLFDENGEKYVIFKIEDASQMLGSYASKYFVNLKKHGFIVRKHSNQSRIYLCDVPPHLKDKRSVDLQRISAEHFYNKSDMFDELQEPYGEQPELPQFPRFSKEREPLSKPKPSKIPIIAAVSLLAVGAVVLLVCRKQRGGKH